MPPSSRIWVRWLPTPEPNSVTLKVEAAVNTLNLTLDTCKIILTLFVPCIANHLPILTVTTNVQFYFEILRTVHRDIFSYRAS